MMEVSSRIMVQGRPRENMRPYPENEEKWLGAYLKW
jgi:hypothetical protein